jgi:glutathione S-transferase
MKHYYHPMSRGVTTDWMLTELAAPHEKILIDFFAGENNTPEYRAINPIGKVPALEDEGRIVTETAAIYAYLADKYLDKGFAPAVGSPDRARYYRYLFFPGTTLEPMFSIAQLGITNFNPQSVGWGDMDRCLATVEAMTPKSDWVMGEQFTAADVVFGGTLDFAMQFGWLQEASPTVAAYVGRIRARPAYQQTHPESGNQ